MIYNVCLYSYIYICIYLFIYIQISNILFLTRFCLFPMGPPCISCGYHPPRHGSTASRQVLSHFSEDVLLFEHGLPDLAPFLGREFRGLQGQRGQNREAPSGIKGYKREIANGTSAMYILEMMFAFRCSFRWGICQLAMFEYLMTRDGWKFWTIVKRSRIDNPIPL